MAAVLPAEVERIVAESDERVAIAHALEDAIVESVAYKARMMAERFPAQAFVQTAASVDPPKNIPVLPPAKDAP